MATYTKEILSGSTNGKNIKVAATTSGSAATTIHTATSGSSAKDEIWLYAQNSDASWKKLTIQFGGIADPDDFVEVDVPPEAGPILVIPGWLLNNSLIVRAFAETTNVVMINGFVNRIT